ncbi:LysR substrate-binding domain-containing protein [Oricola sp.]|uniref:LysR family transcriptional regulator n=1 Tax=Oricola sp. TaxID=1979950 RepID=UPI003BA8C374
MDIISAFKTFVRVAETESFSAAARELNVGQPAVSKQISSLEEHLGVRLFRRSTRSLTLTDAGRDLLVHARVAIEAVEEATDRLMGREGRVAGLLRMTTTIAFGRMHIVPRLGLLKAQYPDLKIDLVLQDHGVNLIEQGLDLAIRFGEQYEPNLIARRMGMIRTIVVASKAYLDANGRPESPYDLDRHETIAFGGRPGGDEWPFVDGGTPLSVKISWRFRIGNSDAIREAALAGLGIAMVPSWVFPDLWELDGMETLFDGWMPPPVPVYAVYPSRRFVPEKVRAMIEFLEHEIRLDPSMTGGTAVF